MIESIVNDRTIQIIKPSAIIIEKGTEPFCGFN